MFAASSAFWVVRNDKRSEQPDEHQNSGESEKNAESAFLLFACSHSKIHALTSHLPDPRVETAIAEIGCKIYENIYAACEYHKALNYGVVARGDRVHDEFADPPASGISFQQRRCRPKASRSKVRLWSEWGSQRCAARF